MECLYKVNCKLRDCDYCSELCERYIKLKYLFENSMMPKSAFSATHLYIDSDGSDRDVFNFLKGVQDNIEEDVRNGINLYLYSQIPGNGKTSWSLRLIKAYLYSVWYKCDLVPKALFINVPMYLLELKSNIQEKSDYVKHIKDNVMSCDIVVWDDIATKSATEFEHEHLLSMIDNRLYNKKCNIFTSNIVPNELDSMLGGRLASRIINESRILPFTGKDKRGLEWKIKN